MNHDVMMITKEHETFQFTPINNNIKDSKTLIINIFFFNDFHSCHILILKNLDYRRNNKCYIIIIYFFGGGGINYMPGSANF
jgi:hypothetical protein